jgi:hypothetical protein
MWMPISSLVLAFASLLGIFVIRAYVAARLLDEDQFAEFKNKGMMGNALNDPTHMLWEYRFIGDVLKDSSIHQSRRTLLAWRMCFAGLVAGMGCFLIASLGLMLKRA